MRLHELTKATADRELLILAGVNSLDVLVPVKATIPIVEKLLKDLDMIAESANKGSTNAMFKNNDRGKEFLIAASKFARRLKSQVQSGESVDVSMPTPQRDQNFWPMSLLGVFKSKEFRPSGEIVRLITSAVSGDLQSFVVQVPRKKRESILLIGTWHPRQLGCATLIADPTTDAAELSDAIGRAVVQIEGPPTRIEGVQVNRSVTNKCRASALAGIIRDRLAACESEPLVVVASKANLAKLGEAPRLRLRSWFDDFDVDGQVVVLGFPGVSPDTIERRLRQTGRAAAILSGGDWGLRFDGRMGYRDPDWHQAHQATAKGLLLQFLARLGRPAVVFTDLELGLPAEKTPDPLDEIDRSIIKALIELGLTDTSATEPLLKKRDKGVGGGKERGTNGSPQYSSVALVSVSNVSAYPIDISKATGLDERRIRRRLGALAGLGLVERVSMRGGWRITREHIHDCI